MKIKTTYVYYPGDILVAEISQIKDDKYKINLWQHPSVYQDYYVLNYRYKIFNTEEECKKHIENMMGIELEYSNKRRSDPIEYAIFAVIFFLMLFVIVNSIL